MSEKCSTPNGVIAIGRPTRERLADRRLECSTPNGVIAIGRTFSALTVGIGSPLCSTPNGVIAIGRLKDLWAKAVANTCSTPNGVIAIGRPAVTDTILTIRKCSTPNGVIAIGSARGKRFEHFLRVVLNA